MTNLFHLFLSRPPHSHSPLNIGPILSRFMPFRASFIVPILSKIAFSISFPVRCPPPFQPGTPRRAVPVPRPLSLPYQWVSSNCWKKNRKKTHLQDTEADLLEKLLLIFNFKFFKNFIAQSRIHQKLEPVSQSNCSVYLPVVRSKRALTNQSEASMAESSL